jgi:cyclase
MNRRGSGQDIGARCDCIEIIRVQGDIKMNKNVKPILIVVFLMLVSISFGRQRDSQPVEFKKISDNLYEILGGSGARTGAYIGDNGVLLIDSKMDKDSVDQVIEGIRKLTDKSIKYLVNTHSDGDHIVGNRYLPQTISFVAHENCRKDFFGPDSRGNPSEWNKPELSPFVPSVTFRDKMDIYLGSKKVELWYFGVGHTTGDIVVYFPEEKTAFIGDQVFLTRPQLIHSYKDGSSFEHVKTLTKMLETIDAEKYCSGHSEITDRTAIKNHIAQMQKMQDKVKELMKQGKTLEQVKAEFDQAEGRLIESIYSEVEK